MKKPLILHIDDDRALRELLAEAMGSAGFDVLSAGSIVDGIKLAMRRVPDLLLLDVHMPDGDGFEACVAFRAVPELSAVPIVLLTASSDEQVQRALDSGAGDCIQKPCAPSQIIATIKKRLAK